MFKNAVLIIDIANDGNQAVDMVKNNDYDFIFMDISMPEKMAYKHVLKSETYPTIKRRQCQLSR